MSKNPLNFKNKWWEKLGLKTDTHGDVWNYGFIDGFNHFVYTAVVTSLVYWYFGAFYAKIVAGAFVALFITLEFIQTYGMKHKYPIWWNPLEWHQGRWQDILLPSIVLVVAMTR